MPFAKVNSERQLVRASPIIRVSAFLFAFSLIVASADIVLVVEISGLSFRASQLVQFVPILVGCAFALYRPPTGIPGFLPFIAWCLILLAFTGHTYHLQYSIGQSAYVIFVLLLVIAISSLYGTNNAGIEALIQWHVLCFVFIAVLGIVQLTLSLFAIDMFVTQWWIPDRLARINGMSFEPSYYATYLITGWGMLAWALRDRFYPLGLIGTFLAFFLVTAAIVLSSSRMALFVLTLYALFIALRTTFYFVFFGRGDRRVAYFAVGTLVAFGLSLVVALLSIDWSNFRFLLFGTGLAGTADHSASIRTLQFEQTLDMFWESPIYGYGIGGLYSYLSTVQGLPPGEATGMNITAEVLASSGIFGFFFFALFMLALLRPALKPDARRTIRNLYLRSLTAGLILTLVILQFNQGILRPYLWNHIAIICALAVAIKQIRISGRGDRKARQAKATIT